ncbi:MAG: class I SAM-dependent methyltransferase [Bacteroidota bacterium]
MGDLETYFNNNNKRLIAKWSNFFDVYEAHFSRFRGKKVCLLEIGVYQGGSLQMWKEYFGSDAEIHGLDINPASVMLEEPQIKIHIGSQSNSDVLRKLEGEIGPIDILIDDGGHMMSQQKITFDVMWPLLADGGVYLCEDLHTSYWKDFGGGYRKSNTFIEKAKTWVDEINAWHSKEAKYNVTDLTRSIASVHFYTSMVVLEKKLHKAPTSLKKGDIKDVPKPDMSLMEQDSSTNGLFSKIFSR